MHPLKGPGWSTLEVWSPSMLSMERVNSESKLQYLIHALYMDPMHKVPDVLQWYPMVPDIIWLWSV